VDAEAMNDDGAALRSARRLREDRERPAVASGVREIDGVADDDRGRDLLRPALLARVVGRESLRAGNDASARATTPDAFCKLHPKPRADTMEGRARVSADHTSWPTALAGHRDRSGLVQRARSTRAPVSRGRSRAARSRMARAEIRACPMADGGEGTLDVP
jgi:hypothetical protein